MHEIEWFVLYVDDEAERTEEVRSYLDGEQMGDHGILRVEVQTSFEEGLRALEHRQYDIVILDVRQHDKEGARPEEEAGRIALEEIRARRFLPVVFYTGLPNLVEDLRSPLIRVLEKTEGVERLEAEVRDILDNGLPAVSRALRIGLERVQRDYLWSAGAEWQGDAARQNSGELLYVLARRLAATLTGSMITELAAAVGAPEPSSGDQRHPVQLYIAPPVTNDPHPGEIMRRSVDGAPDQHLIVLTPACDIVQGRAQFVLLARCLLLKEQPEYVAWAADKQPSETKARKLNQLLRNNRQGERERFYFMPRAFDVPDLVIDFQQLESLPLAELEPLRRVAALDAPFAQAMLAQFVRYFGRIGTPDLDVDGVVMERLKRER